VYSLEVAVRPAAGVALRPTVALVHIAEIDAKAIFRFVTVEHGVASVIARLANQPTEDAGRVKRIDKRDSGSCP
jgi:hypothetical protein